jgi:tetratricopeptide (TPR) repeat protein
MLAQQGDRQGAIDAYRRADERGNALGALNLGRMLAEQGDRQGAIDAFRRARERGDAHVSRAARAAWLKAIGSE